MHSCIGHIWTREVVEVYGGSTTKPKQTKYKACLCSLNLKEDNPVTSRVHHTPTRFVVIYYPRFINDLRSG